MISIVDMRERPHHLGRVARIVHREWWSQTTTPPEVIRNWLKGHLGAEGFPATFLAMYGEELAGFVALHLTEAEDRPAYQPYLGALFVQPEHRSRGIGAALVRSVEARARDLGHAAIYLNAGDACVGLYEGLGWEVIERGYGARRQLSIMRRALGRSPPQLPTVRPRP
jgi:GNAT superfamily N-acetyltransferase